MPQNPIQLMNFPDELLEKIVLEKEQNSLAAVNHRFHKIVQEPRIVSKLLYFVARGEEARVKALFKLAPSNIRYLIAGGAVEDYSGRQFSRISAFQYALWALDWHMWTMMLMCVKDAYFKGYLGADEIRNQLLIQAQQVITEGVDYSLNGIKVKGEPHFNLKPLVEALQIYASHFYIWPLEQRKNYWCHEIGGLQLEIPAHVAQEYCRSDQSFFPMPSFTEKNLPRTLCIYNQIVGQQEIWWAADSLNNSLGIELGVSRVALKKAHNKTNAFATGGKGRSGDAVAIDASAISTLNEIRSKQFHQLIDELNVLFLRHEKKSGLISISRVQSITCAVL